MLNRLLIVSLLFSLNPVSKAQTVVSTIEAELEADSIILYKVYDEKSWFSGYILSIKTKKGWWNDTILQNDAVSFDGGGIEYIYEKRKKEELVEMNFYKDYEHSYGGSGGWGIYENYKVIYDLNAKKILFTALYHHSSGEHYIEFDSTGENILKEENSLCVYEYVIDIDSNAVITISELKLEGDCDQSMPDNEVGVYELKKGKYIRKEDD